MSDPRIVSVGAGPTALDAGCGDPHLSATQGAGLVNDVLLSEPETAWIPRGE